MRCPNNLWSSEWMTLGNMGDNKGVDLLGDWLVCVGEL